MLSNLWEPCMCSCVFDNSPVSLFCAPILALWNHADDWNWICKCTDSYKRGVLLRHVHDISSLHRQTSQRYTSSVIVLAVGQLVRK